MPTIRGRDLKAGDIVIKDDKEYLVSSLEWMSQNRKVLITGPDGTKAAIRIIFDGDNREYFLYPSAVLTIRNPNMCAD